MRKKAKHNPANENLGTATATLDANDENNSLLANLGIFKFTQQMPTPMEDVQVAKNLNADDKQLSNTTSMELIPESDTEDELCGLWENFALSSSTSPESDDRPANPHATQL